MYTCMYIYVHVISRYFFEVVVVVSIYLPPNSSDPRQLKSMYIILSEQILVMGHWRALGALDNSICGHTCVCTWV